MEEAGGNCIGSGVEFKSPDLRVEERSEVRSEVKSEVNSEAKSEATLKKIRSGAVISLSLTLRLLPLPLASVSELIITIHSTPSTQSTSPIPSPLSTL